jgi:dTDP-4-dehydrorhamnose reductase
LRYLVFGKNGQVGSRLTRLLGIDSELTACGRDDVDLSDASGLRALIDSARPDVIVNAAAYTAVDQAEQEPQLAAAVNAEAPRVIAEQAKQLDALFVHFSTDYVFDGTASDPYLETDPTNPINVYGATKQAGEAAVVRTGGRYLVLRTSWVFSSSGRNFLNTVRRLVQERPSLSIVNDQVGSPSLADDLAAATVKIVNTVTNSNENLYGTYHLTGDGSTSWYDFARAIVAGVGSHRVSVTPIATADYPTPARRPQYSVLNTDKVRQRLGVIMPSWRDAVARCLND